MNWNLSSVLPPTSTDAAAQWDHLYWFLFAVIAVFFAVVIVPMTVFLIKYRKRPGRKTDPIEHNAPLEVLWTAIPTVILMVIFAWGWIVYRDLMYRVPNDAMEVNVVAESWGWTFQYDDGRMEKNRLVVPVDRAVRLKMTSKPGDVLHSFFVPNFRIKRDLVPGLYTQTFFKANDVGRHIFFCTEYCGLGHSAMYGDVVVLSQEDFRLWRMGKEVPLPAWIGVGGLTEKLKAQIEAQTASTEVLSSATAAVGEGLVERGELLYRKMGCVACHTSDGSEGIGPSFKGLYGSERVMIDEEIFEVDANYLRESIENPQAKIVSGYEDLVMPPYPGHVSEFDLNALVAYIKSLR
jgi:cytochrome c oxidase subunit 2